ncbi:MAG TPA: CPBP family intramembrane glutamic endopeptidase [Rhodocyclaceae bacterium]|nr:CPBP family intramembrane glutamic endopeptidase [Rhodocyclaceae bacterium]
MFVFWGSSLLCLALGAGSRVRLVLRDDLRWAGKRALWIGAWHGLGVWGRACFVLFAMVALLIWFSPDLPARFATYAKPAYTFRQGGALAAAAYMFFACVFAPIVEEILFRGLIFRRWQARWGGTRAAILSSALFAILHPAVLPQFCMGLLSCLLLVRTGSLWPCIALHVTNNALCMIAELATNSSGQSVEPLSLDWTFTIWLGAYLLCFVWYARYLWRYWGDLRQAQPLYQFTDAGIPGRIVEA